MYNSSNRYTIDFFNLIVLKKRIRDLMNVTVFAVHYALKLVRVFQLHFFWLQPRMSGELAEAHFMLTPFVHLMWTTKK